MREAPVESIITQCSKQKCFEPELKTSATERGDTNDVGPSLGVAMAQSAVSAMVHLFTRVP